MRKRVRPLIRKKRNKTVILLVVGVLILFLSACEKSTKHKILTFFFTGVPTLEEIERQKKEAEKKRKQKEMQNKQQNAAKTAKPSLPEKQAAPVQAVRLYSHTPYAEGRCDGCHGGLTGFRGFRSKGMVTTFSKGGGMPGVLVAPRTKLCIICHEYLSPDAAAEAGLWLHTAAEEGDCDACHAPHQSNYPGVLIDRFEEICRSCHAEENIMKIPDHRKPGECLDCHNAHLGKNRQMLKKDYQEKYRSVKSSPDSPATGVLPGSDEKRSDGGRGSGSPKINAPSGTSK